MRRRARSGPRSRTQGRPRPCASRKYHPGVGVQRLSDGRQGRFGPLQVALRTEFGYSFAGSCKSDWRGGRYTALRISMTGKCLLFASLRTTSSSLAPGRPLTGALGAAHRALLGQSARGSYLGFSFDGGARV